MKDLRILHITPWFPNPQNPVEAVFIARHIKSLADLCENKTLHIRFDGPGRGIENDEIYGIETTRVNIRPFIDRWRVREYLAAKFVKKYLKKNRAKFDLVNFIIAYPNAVNISGLIKNFPEIGFAMTEQWSAYHNNFGLSENNKGRKRIARIFDNDVPLFVVSNALGEDIRKFSGIADRPYEVIPNIVDPMFTFRDKSLNGQFVFASINNWSPLKNPFVLIKAFQMLNREFEQTRLVLGGDGSLVPEMKALVKSCGLEGSVEFTGRLNKSGVLDVLYRSHAYCQSSNYETFSVICAEALSTGTPVIAANTGGIRDFVDGSNGALVDELEPELWYKKMKFVMENYGSFDRKSFSEQIRTRFSRENVGRLFYANLCRAVANS
jgi:glycosyltransferase involved in cell wall biosynthesis